MAGIALQYTGSSAGEGGRLNLAAARAPGAGAFAAEIRDPRVFRAALLALGEIVKADFELMDYEEWRESVLDPVVGVHPDGVSFEAFSRDGSTLGWAQFERGVFGEPEVLRPGCTSIDYSPTLERYLQSMSFATRARLTIGTEEGVKIAGAAAAVHEKRIDLPDDWLHGFGELHAGLLQARWKIELARADLPNILRALRPRRDVKRAKRALIFELRPGEPARARLEPWDLRIDLQGPAPEVDEAVEIKVYGRRRLALIEKLLPMAESAAVYLIDDARPSYWELRLPGARLTLALSAWTSRTFTKTVGEGLLSARSAVGAEALARAAERLCAAGNATFAELGEAAGTGEEEARGVALALCRQGLAFADPAAGRLRWRPLLHFPFAEISARGAAVGREERAEGLIESGKICVESVRRAEGMTMAAGTCEGSAGRYRLSLALNADGSFASGDCECAWVRRNALRAGPCKHLLALREIALREGKRSGAREEKEQE